MDTILGSFQIVAVLKNKVSISGMPYCNFCSKVHCVRRRKVALPHRT